MWIGEECRLGGRACNGGGARPAAAAAASRPGRRSLGSLLAPALLLSSHGEPAAGPSRAVHFRRSRGQAGRGPWGRPSLHVASAARLAPPTKQASCSKAHEAGGSAREGYRAPQRAQPPRPATPAIRDASPAAWYLGGGLEGPEGVGAARKTGAVRRSRRACVLAWAAAVPRRQPAMPHAPATQAHAPATQAPLSAGWHGCRAVWSGP